MTDVSFFLLAIAAIFLLGTVGELVFRRTGVPDVVWLIAVGILLGPVLGYVDHATLSRLAPYFAALTLIIVLFEGGARLNLGELAHAAPRSVALAVIGFVLSAAVVAPLTMLAARIGLLPAGWTWLHGWMTGCIVGGSSSIVIMPAMEQAGIDERVSNLVNLESALTDALCVVGAAAFIDILAVHSSGHPAVVLARSFGFGIIAGAIAGFLWLLILRVLRGHEHGYVITLSALFILYVVVDHSGGSAALAILTFAILVGNAPSLSRRIGLAQTASLDKDVQGVHHTVTFMVKSFFFTFIGAMFAPPWTLIAFGAVLGAVLWVARQPAVWLIARGGAFDRDARRVIGVCMPRGLAAGVLATMPVAAGVAATDDVPTIVFACVLTTILIFSVGLPLVRPRRREPIAGNTAAALQPEAS